MKKFDYESKVWGANQFRLDPTYLGYFHLKYALAAIKGKKGRLLDLGCGAGGLTKAIKKYRPDLEIWGIDVSEKVIDQAKKDSEGVNFKTASVYDTGFPDNYFDILVHFDVFEHLTKPELAVKEAKRVLKKGGIIHGFTPCEGENYSYTKWVRKFGWKSKVIFCGHIQPYSFSTLKKLFTTHGFEVEKVRTSGHFFYQLSDFLFFSWLLLRGKNLSSSIETLVAKNNKNLFFQALDKVKKFLSLIFFMESTLFSFLPGFGLHLTLKEVK